MRETEPISFHYPAGRFHFNDRKKLKVYLTRLLKRNQKKLAHINYIFCDDAYLLSLNKEYLNHDTLTDIITFELSAEHDPIVSDIYISVERVRENARLFNSSFRHELHRVLFHGALHLIGYKDKSATEAKLMRKMEESCLEEYFVPRETREVKP